MGVKLGPTRRQRVNGGGALRSMPAPSGGCNGGRHRSIVCWAEASSISMIPCIVNKHIQGGVFCNQLLAARAALWISHLVRSSPFRVGSSQMPATTGDDDFVARER